MTNKDTFNELEMFNRLNEAGVHVYFMIGDPDGLIKEIILPVDDDLYKKYLTLESGASAIHHKYRGNAELFLVKEGKPFAKASFPVIVITVFYKHLFKLLVKMKEHRLIREGKIYRLVVATPVGAELFGVKRNLSY